MQNAMQDQNPKFLVDSMAFSRSLLAGPIEGDRHFSQLSGAGGGWKREYISRVVFVAKTPIQFAKLLIGRDEARHSTPRRNAANRAAEKIAQGPSLYSAGRMTE
jgi:hypothetical protein